MLRKLRRKPVLRFVKGQGDYGIGSGSRQYGFGGDFLAAYGEVLQLVDVLG